MGKTAIGSVDPDTSLISLSLKPRKKWLPFVTAIFSYSAAIACGIILAMNILLLDALNALYTAGLLSEPPKEEIGWWLIPVGVLFVYWGVSNTTQATKSAWYTKHVDKDINTEGVVILKPISKSD